MQVFKVLFLLIFSACGAGIDWRTRRLPNVLTVPGVVVGLLFHAIDGYLQSGWTGGYQSLLFSMLGFLTGFGLLLVVWLAGGGGAGDVKLVGAIGAWIGPWATLAVVCLACLVAAVFVCGMLLQKLVRTVMRNSETGNHPSVGAPAPNNLPFGVPAAIATWLYVLYAEVLRPWLLG